MMLAGGASMVYHFMSDDDVDRIMKHPHVAIASDSSLLTFGEGVPHPRGYGNNARVLGEYVRTRHVIPLEEAIRKMTSLPAAQFRFAQPRARQGGLCRRPRGLRPEDRRRSRDVRAAARLRRAASLTSSSTACRSSSKGEQTERAAGHGADPEASREEISGLIQQSGDRSHARRCLSSDPIPHGVVIPLAASSQDRPERPQRRRHHRNATIIR